jgi:AsmA protein
LSQTLAPSVLETTAISEANTNQRTTRSRVLKLFIVFCVVAFLALSVIAPFVNAARFSTSVQLALEESLGRKVSFEKVYYRLLPVPGFSLENVIIADNARYGLEPFAAMTGLEARLRIDKLLVGQIRFASLRLVDPSLNLVKRDDGAWNVLEFVQRMSAPRRMPLNFVPAIQVTNGRLDFKLGTRKTTFYITDADMAIYPERSGRVVMNFSGSPARTDRAGNGFGSMRGTLNWLVNPATGQGNQLEADVTLLPSDLSELTTLIEGQDMGVHGTISSRAQIAGPLAALRVTGDLRLRDVHRWDLLPSTGDDWRVPYGGTIDMMAHKLELRTLPQNAGDAVPAAVQVKVNDFLTKPAWTLMTSLNKAPVEMLLPLARRMGFAVPAGVALSGAIDGAVGYSNNGGFAGEVSIQNAVAKLPDIAPISAAGAALKILPDGLHLEPATLQATGGGTLQVGGDYSWTKQHLAAAITVNEVSIDTLKSTAQAWFGAPAALASLTGGKDGAVTGELHYDNGVAGVPAGAGWSGQFQFTDATLAAAGVAVPLKKAQGHVVFTPETFDLTHFSAMLEQRAVQGTYRYNQTAKRQERLHVELPEADFEEIAAALEPAWREPGLLARLPFTKWSIPDWMAARNMEGDVAITRFRANKADLGPMNTRFVWQGAHLQIADFELHTPEVALNGSGSIDLEKRVPVAHFKGGVSGYRWGGGTVNAEGEVDSTGMGSDVLRSLHAVGQCWGTDVSLSLNEDFEKVSGAFDLSFADGWPKLHLLKVEAVQRDQDWNGEAVSNSEGQLVFDLGSGDKQLHIVSIMTPVQPSVTPAAAAGEKIAQK